MSRQDASAPEGAGKAIDFDEAERLASMIRPAWEVDLVPGDLAPPKAEAALEAPAGPAITPPRAAGAAPASPSVPGLTDSERKLADGGADPSATSSSSASLLPRDTVIDGVPTVGVGERTSAPAGDVAAAIKEGIAIVDRGAQPSADAPPRRAGPTKLGLGDVPLPSASEITTATAVGPSLREAGAESDAAPSAPAMSPRPSGGTIRMEAPRVSRVEPAGASPSRIEDPIELPVQKSSKFVLIFVGALVVAGAIVGGVMAFSGGPAPKPATTDTAAPRATTTPATAAGTETAAATATATSEPAPTAATTATATASATTTASVTATTSAAEVPTAKPAPTEKPATKPTSKPTSKPTGTTPAPKPTSTGGGTIIRDTPF